MTKMIVLKPGQKHKVAPHYDTKDYRAFCKSQKAKGLRRKFWPDLPKMWKQELEFRQSFQRALQRFSDGP